MVQQDEHSHNCHSFYKLDITILSYTLCVAGRSGQAKVLNGASDFHVFGQPNQKYRHGQFVEVNTK